MKKVLSLIILSLISLGLFAQGGNIGAFVGASYYNGEVNPQKVLYMPSMAYGIMYRHDINNRMALKFQGDYTILKASDANSKNEYQIIRNYSFSNIIWDLGAQFELNFLDFNTEDFMTNYFTPYISTGVYLGYEPASAVPFFVSVPIEFGFKYALTKKITIGAMWQYRWTSSDQIDGLTPDIIPFTQKQSSYNPDKDLISYVGAFITFSLFKETIFCPAY